MQPVCGLGHRFGRGVTACHQQARCGCYQESIPPSVAQSRSARQCVTLIPDYYAYTQITALSIEPTQIDVGGGGRYQIPHDVGGGGRTPPTLCSLVVVLGVGDGRPQQLICTVWGVGVSG